MTDECAVLMDCADYGACVNACESGDAACNAACDARTTFAAFDAYGAVVDCVVNNCSEAPDFNACMLSACGDQYFACFSGPENCGWLWGCVSHCGPFPDCIGDCLVEGTRAAQDEVLAVVNCIGDACGELDPAGDCWAAAITDGGACAGIHATCAATCTPDCEGKQCGDSGCGYECATCDPGFICSDEFTCETCTVECGGAECGPSNCPGVDCGTCDAGSLCQEGTCVEVPHCTPDQATPIGCDETVSGNNSAGTSIFATYGCAPDWDESGPEVIYSFTAEADDQLFIGFSGPLTADLDLFAMDGTCMGEGCLTGGDIAMRLDVTAGETYYLVVEGYEGATSDYTLTLDCASENCGGCPSGQLCEGGACVAPECDRTGFTAAEEQATFNAAEPHVAFYTAQSSAAAPYDLFQLELWFDLEGAPTAPGSYPITEGNYATCALCVFGATGCGDQGCEKSFYAGTGLLELTEVPDSVGDTFGGTFSNVVLREVTIDPNAGYISTPIADGERWCVEGFSFQMTTSQAQ